MALEIITSDLLSPFRHGFFTRKGGASSGIYSGLNCGFGSSDQSEVVHINRARVAGALEARPEDLAGVNQVHSADAVAVDGPTSKPLPEADAVATATPGVVLMILTADCAPVLFADPQAGVVGAAHAAGSRASRRTRRMSASAPSTAARGACPTSSAPSTPCGSRGLPDG